MASQANDVGSKPGLNLEVFPFMCEELHLKIASSFMVMENIVMKTAQACKVIQCNVGSPEPVLSPLTKLGPSNVTLRGALYPAVRCYIG